MPINGFFYRSNYDTLLRGTTSLEIEEKDELRLFFMGTQLLESKFCLVAFILHIFKYLYTFFHKIL